MRIRLLVVLGVLAVALAVGAAPAAAAGGVASSPAVGTVLEPGHASVADNWLGGDCGCGWGGASSGMPFGGWGFPGGFSSPWWAGMPLGTISATTGGTWPWAPWYWTPQWWTFVALSNAMH